MTTVLVLALTFLTAASGVFAEEQFIKAKCFSCGKLYRVPVRDTDVLLVTCPHCGTQAQIKMPEPAIIAWEKANKYIGKEKVIEGTVVNTYVSPRSNNLYLNLNPDYNTYGSVAIKSEDRGKFGETPEVTFKGKKVRITGKIIEHKGKPRIWLNDPGQIEAL